MAGTGWCGLDKKITVLLHLLQKYLNLELYGRIALQFDVDGKKCLFSC